MILVWSHRLYNFLTHMTDAPKKVVLDLTSAFNQSPLYAIIDPAVRPDLPALDILNSLINAGVKVIQYRHKDTFHRAHWDECCTLAQRATEAGALFFVNDRADIALLSRADGVHLGQDDLPPNKAREFLGDDKLIGFSTHTQEHAKLANTFAIDYLAIGPVFATGTKKNPDPVVGLDMVRSVRSMTSKPLVAIGGITMQNAHSVLAAGADAVAVIGDLLSASDIESHARAFLHVLRH